MICIPKLIESMNREINKNNGEDPELEEFLIQCSTLFAFCAKEVPQPDFNIPLELALTRWSVVHIRLNDLCGDCPSLPAFLAGWFCRSIGASEPMHKGRLKDSFNHGWKEADSAIQIRQREKE